MMRRIALLMTVCAIGGSLAVPLAAETAVDVPVAATSSCIDDPAASQLCFALTNSDAMIGVETSGGRGNHPYYILMRHGDAWSISARSTRRVLTEGDVQDWSTRETREISRPVDASAAQSIIAMLTADNLAAFDATTLYPAGSICTDGSILTVAANLETVAGEWQRHSCHSQTKLDELAAALRELAISVDPALARLES
jgi:hypothetical protein